MGFSVSGAGAIVFLTALTVFASLFTVVLSVSDEVAESYQQRLEALETQSQEDLSITNATRTGNGSTLTVEIENTGTASIRVSELVFVLDGQIETPKQTAVTSESAGASGSSPGAHKPWTDIVQPGETLTAEFRGNSAENITHVRVTTSTDTADTASVEGAE